MSEKNDYDPYMCDFEREVFEALGQEFKYSPRELKLIKEFYADILSLDCSGNIVRQIINLKEKWKSQLQK